ncbi:carbohydrate kinase family protein [Candidatus Woesearchaeota archaeon]|nr:carbohydrate kinase family protein [Candidatus Woesearchaeota archaeon]
MYDAITVGSGTIDVFVDTGKKLFHDAKKGYVHVPFGSKILVEKLNMDTGGGGTNCAVSLSRLGLKVAWIGKTGAGANSERILSQMKKENVDTSLVKREKGGRTGFSVILDAKGHDRTILAYKGSNDDLGWDEIPKQRLKTRWIYCSSMVGKSFKTLEKLVEHARKNKIKVAFNPSSYLAKKGAKYISKAVRNTNLIVMNNEESYYLTKTKNIKQALKKIYLMGPEIVVITEGAKGCHAYDGKEIYSIKPHNVNVVEATGAGDSFASAFLAGIIKKNDIKFALKLGLANAESVITHFGAKNKLLTWKEAMKKINY